jgi:hypothetical protein
MIRSKISLTLTKTYLHCILLFSLPIRIKKPSLLTKDSAWYSIDLVSVIKVGWLGAVKAG